MAGAGLCVALVALMCAATALGGNDIPLVGAPQALSDFNDEGLQQALGFAMEEYNNASNDMYLSRVVRIISAKRQVVAGLKYIMEVEIARTTCEKPAAAAPLIENCALPDSPQLAKRTVCRFVVYNVPWLGKTELLQSKCQ